MRKTGGFLSKIFDSFYRLKSTFRKNLFLTYPYVAVKSYPENVKPLSGRPLFRIYGTDGRSRLTVWEFSSLLPGGKPRPRVCGTRGSSPAVIARDVRKTLVRNGFPANRHDDVPPGMAARVMIFGR